MSARQSEEHPGFERLWRAKNRPGRPPYLWLAALSALVSAAVGCNGRSGQISPPPVRIAAVVADSVTVGARGVHLEVILANGTEHDLTVVACEPEYRGAGRAFHLRSVDDLPALPAGGTAVVGFIVGYPVDGAAGDRVEGRADIVNLGTGESWRITSADAPLVLEASTDIAPDISGLAALLVTVSDDELDGGTTLEDITGAGGEADLSLREALTIVANLGVPHRIAFDPYVFDPSRALPIAIGAEGALPAVTVADTAIDGFGLDPTIELVTDETFPALTVTASRVTLRGLTIRGFHFAVRAAGADDLRLTDSRFSVYNDYSVIEIGLSASARVTVQNVSVFGTSANGSALAAAGCDDLTLDGLQLNLDINISGSAGVLVTAAMLQGGADMTLTNTPSAWVVGNTVTGVWSGSAIAVDGASAGTRLLDNFADGPHEPNPLYPTYRIQTGDRVTLSRSTATSAPVPIGLMAGANGDIPAPRIELASPSSVSGSSSAPDESVVELFEDPQGCMATFRGETTTQGGIFAFNGLDLETGTWVRATVTDLDGNTSEASPAVAVSP